MEPEEIERWRRGDAPAQARLWTRWWWPGNALDEAEISRHLDAFHAAGFGGVEVSPIYATEDGAPRQVPFLSPRFAELLAHTVREADRHGMRVDLILGTGWPFGGPWVSPRDAAKKWLFQRIAVPGGGVCDTPLRHPDAPDATARLVAADRGPERVVLTDRLDPESGRLDWRAPDGDPWTLRAAWLVPTGQQVKRAGPGGAGPVLDHLDPDALARYLRPFEELLAALPAPGLRACFNDSWEVYGATGSDAIPARFRQERGADLAALLPEWMGDGDPEAAARVRADYRRTVEETVRDSFVGAWTRWAHARGLRTRHQAHGSPGNLLDLYAAADIPETELFQGATLRLAGLAPLGGTPAADARTGREELFACRLAASAARIAGKPLVSSESFTWLGEHGRVPLQHLKTQADLLFVAGVNHLFCQGAMGSPADAPWPGWRFYAATHVGPTTAWWDDLPAFSRYVARCQSLLQQGEADADLLVYFPIEDHRSARRGDDVLLFWTVHNTAEWLRDGMPTLAAAQESLLERGWSFDLVSDRLLDRQIRASGGALEGAAGRWRALLVPGARVVPPDTLERLIRLAEDGATVLFLGGLPDDVPGLNGRDEALRRLRAACARVERAQMMNDDGTFETRVGAGRVLVGGSLDPLLEAAGLRRAAFADQGVRHTRRRIGDDTLLFLTHTGEETFDAVATLHAPRTTPARAAQILDPMSGRVGEVFVAHTPDGGSRVPLRIRPGESLFVRLSAAPVGLPPWNELRTTGTPLPLTGPWDVRFVSGGPMLPAPRTVAALGDWCGWDEVCADFSGTVCYRRVFSVPDPGAPWSIELGEVLHSARVRVNGIDAGTLAARPWRLPLPPLQAEGNVLEVFVTNLDANRLAAMDRAGVPWRRFFFVDAAYRPFDASGWPPLPSGLMGPVRLVRLEAAP